MWTKKPKLFAGVLVLLLGVGFWCWQQSRLLPHRDLGLFISTGRMIADPELSRLGKNKSPLTPEAAKTLVMQLKDSDGLVAFKSTTAEKWRVPLHQPTIDVGLISKWKAKGFRTVAYFQVFKDKAFVEAHPSEGITGQDGRIFRDAYGAFVDPGSSQYHDYFFSLIEEVLAQHPDEVMLDYIRFPEYSGLLFPVSKISEDDLPNKEKTVTAFVRQLREFIRSKSPGVKLSCAIFPPNNSIGQNYRDLAGSVDIISPMIYPNIFSGPIAGKEWEHAFDGLLDSIQTETAHSQIIIRPFVQGFQFYRDADNGSRRVKSLEPDLMRWQIARMQGLGWGCLVFSSSSSYGNLWRVLK